MASGRSAEPNGDRRSRRGGPGRRAGEQAVDASAARTDATVMQATAIETIGGYPFECECNGAAGGAAHSDSLVRLTAVRSLPANNEEMLVMNLASVIINRASGALARHRSSPIEIGQAHRQPAESL